MHKTKTGLRSLKIIALIIAAFVLGYAAKSLVGPPEPAAEHDHPPESTAEQQQWWTCSMHPQIRQPKPGKCPICFMDLIPASSSGADVGERQITFSPAALKLMEIATTPVERKFVTAEVRMVGKIDYDETRVKNITAWVPGRIDRLYVDFTGTTVNKGDHMVYLYSPELLEDQQALLAALEASRSIRPDSSDFAKTLKVGNIEAARKRLKLRGLSDEQIDAIEQTGKPVDHITIYSPIGGVVIHKSATEGMYVNTGTPIYTVADLTQLWVKLDAYESDLPWIRYGQKVEFTAEAYPGELFEGTINFRDPVLNEKTRTVKLRVNVDNTDGTLKPGMFVRAVVRSQVARGGKVMAPEMAGKWICPMHPAVVKTEAGACDICGMDLVTTESLGYVVDTPREAPLVIPASAPLITGTRAVVYVQVPDQEKPTFEGRQVTLGPRAGEYYLVKEGLAEGESVVTKGNFKIDSALQIEAKPSMMSPAGTETAAAHRHAVREQVPEILDVPGAFREQLWSIVEKYLSIHQALAGDNKDRAVAAARAATEALSAVDMTLLAGQPHELWMKRSDKINEALDLIEEAGQIEKTRQAFEQLSNELITVVKHFGVPENRSLNRFHCPMAFNNKGADWLQGNADTLNPYFGASMLKCGEVAEAIGKEMK
ncbi:MAG: efflux RND transporter periplasmic adaptor subunit [Phycisphaerales bacterium]|nr:MAG: efflux RND transporter periplasmic adaptor subunit [Phycisphaerales bacterium]